LTAVSGERERREEERMGGKRSKKEDEKVRRGLVGIYIYYQADLPR